MWKKCSNGAGGCCKSLNITEGRVPKSSKESLMEMDLSDKDNFNPEKRNEDHLNYHSSSMPPSWQFDSTNLTDQPMGMGLLPMNNSMSTCPGDAIGSSTISSVPMMDSFSPNLWGNPSSQNITLGDNHIHASASVGKGIPGASRTGFVKALDLDWNLRSSMPKEGLFIPQTLSQFPADSAFIERAAAAARFSCFTSGPFSDIVNPFSESMNPHFKDEQATQAPHEAMLDDRLNMKPTSGAQSLINESNMTEIAKYVSEPVKQGSIEGSPTDKPRRMGGFIKSPDEEKLEIGISSNDSYEAEVSGTRGQGVSENANGEPSSSKGCASKKRRKSGQVADMNKGEAAKDNNETAQKNDQSAASTAKASKNSQDSSPNSDAPKEDYIHVRARRGQATNSHSLAERVRREKISERMKFLQDLVPGCSKVTGKAVMLDEIINYVQSLQRQVEFLSMKLASVNPCLDAHTEGLLAKDVREVLQLRDGSSSFPFSRDTRMVHPQGNPPPQGLVQLMAVNGGFKGPTPQIPSAWEEELNNVMQMNFGTNASFNEQDTNASRPAGDRKDEL